MIKSATITKVAMAALLSSPANNCGNFNIINGVVTRQSISAVLLDIGQL